MEPLEDASTVEQMLLKKAADKRIPINGSLELLPLCNLNCKMCYVRLSRREMEQQGRLRTAEEWLELGRQMVQNGVLFLLLTGGEPLLHPEFQKIYLGLKQMGLILTINTNGTLIDKSWAAFFGEHKPRRVNITLYGADDRAYEQLCRYPGGFEKVMHGIRLLRHHGVDVRVGGSLTKINERDLDRLLALGNELDVPVRVDTYMMPATRERQKPFDQQSRLDPEAAARARVKALRGEMGEELFFTYARTMISQIHEAESPVRPRHMTCLAGSCSFTINWQGEMRPCVVMTEPAAPVFELGFAEAWKQIGAQVDKILLNPACSVCAMRPICRTCAACALLETGSYDGVPEYMCQYTKETLRLLQASLDEQKGEDGHP